MQTIFIAILFLPASYNGYLNCKIACRSCKEQNYVPELLEVYCGMCNECKMRRQEQLKYRIGRKADDQNKKQYTEITVESLTQEEMTKQSEEQKPEAYDEGLQQDVEPVRLKNERPDVKQKLYDSASQENYDDHKEVATDYTPKCTTPPPCSEDEEAVRTEHLLFSPGPLSPPYHPPYCSVYTPCVYPYPSFPHTTTTKPYVEPTTTTSTTIATTTSTTTTERSIPKRHALKETSRKPKPKRIRKPIAAVPLSYMPAPCFVPYNPCPNLLPPMPLAPISIPPLPHMPASQHPLNMLGTTIEPKVTKDHYYVYVGVPKNMLQS